MVENQGGAPAPPATITATIEVEYLTGDERLAKAWAEVDALAIFVKDNVLAVTVDEKPTSNPISDRELPITRQYLEDDGA